MDINPENPTVVEKYRCTRNWEDTLLTGHAGGFFDWVADNALFVIPRSVDFNPAGTLWLQDIKITEDIYGRLYHIDAPYGPTKKEIGAYQLTVDLIGGTVHITAGELISVWPTQEGNGGLIGVDGDEVHGADVVVPEMKLIVSYRAPKAFLNQAYINSLLYLIGHFNNDVFLNYAQGQVQFLGGPFTESEAEATARYSFAISPNETNLVIAGITITGIKYGSDLVVPTYADKTTAESKPGKEATFLEVIRPPSHSWKNFIPVIGWG